MRSSLPVLTLALGLATAPTAWSQAPTVTTPPTSSPIDRAADTKAIASVVAGFNKAFEAGDASAVAAYFSDDAQVSDQDGSTSGRAAIQERFTAYFAANPKPKIEIKIDTLRFLSPDVAIEDGKATLTASPTSRPEMTKYQVVYVRQAGKWLQSSLDETTIDDMPIPDRLKELEWLQGEWVTESSESVVHSTCAWSEDKHYLLRDFTVTIQGKVAIKGTQRIGWDASAKQIRSWMFDSMGGFNEGYWTRSGEQWLIRTHGVGSDGKPGAATQMITRVSPTALKWSAFDRTRGGELIPEVEEYNLVRRPPTPGTKPVKL